MNQHRLFVFYESHNFIEIKGFYYLKVARIGCNSKYSGLLKYLITLFERLFFEITKKDID